MTSEFLSVSVKKYAGGQEFSVELLDRSSPAFFDELVRQMEYAYAKATDVAVVTGLIAGGISRTGATAGLPGTVNSGGYQASCAFQACPEPLKGSSRRAYQRCQIHLYKSWSDRRVVYRLSVE